MNEPADIDRVGTPRKAHDKRRIRVCFVLSYRDPDYIRSRSLCVALKKMPGVELILATNRSSGLKRYWETLHRLLQARKKADPDIYILGFRGHEIAVAVRWLTRGKPLIFDAMMSPYAAMREERKLGWPGRLIAPLWRVFEGAALRNADAVLTDTNLHVRYYVDTFGIDSAKIVAIPVGAIESDVASDAVTLPRPEKKFTVLFYGSFLPLHGFETIIAACDFLTDIPIEFRFIGGSTLIERRLRAAFATRTSLSYTHMEWLPLDHLVDIEIPGADLCLGGPFGGTPQARRVVTGKTSQCLALGKATAIGRIDEAFGFVDRVNCLLVDQGSATSLAEAIRWSYENRSPTSADRPKRQIALSFRAFN